MKKAKNFIYLRVSTDEQDVENQKHGIMGYVEARGLTPVEEIRDTASGSADWRKRAIGQIIERASEGDVIIVSEVSRLARSTLQTLEIMQEAVKKGVSIHITKNQIVMDGSMQATITATVLGLAAEIEREFISARTKEGLARRKAEGKTLGRPKGSKSKYLKLDDHRKAIERYLSIGVSKRSIAKICGVSHMTLYDYIRRRGL